MSLRTLRRPVADSAVQETRKIPVGELAARDVERLPGKMAAHGHDPVFRDGAGRPMSRQRVH